MKTALTECILEMAKLGAMVTVFGIVSSYESYDGFKRMEHKGLRPLVKFVQEEKGDFVYEKYGLATIIRRDWNPRDGIVDHCRAVSLGSRFGGGGVWKPTEHDQEVFDKVKNMYQRRLNEE